jgi:Mycothiol maleylpyruvate isomerase N-terminal domain
VNSPTLATLTPERWGSPSLCDSWRVRDVVAHVFSYEDLGLPGLVGRFVSGGLNPDRINAIGTAGDATRTYRRLGGYAAGPVSAVRLRRLR